LRVIAGDARGKRLFSPADRSIRPTSDKVKGAIFNMISAYIQDAVVVDLFSGCGSLGVEALSRGALRCYFCDSSAKARALTEKNVAHCGMSGRSELLCCDYRAALGMRRDGAGSVVLDPPYERDYCEGCLEVMASAACVHKGSLAVCEHGASRRLPESVFGFVKIKEKKYGITGVTVFSYEGGA
jgi:16S rRNA (guanine(966)-N(2))-methyltransferase RsmD